MIATLALFSISILCGVLAVVCYNHWQLPAARALLLLFVGLVLSTSGYALEILLPTLETKMQTVRLQYLGIVCLPIAWLMFAKRFGGSTPSLSKRTGIMLWVVPAITILMVFTYESHSFFYTQIAIKQTSLGPMLALKYGPVFWIHTIYSYLLLVLGCIILVRAMLHAPTHGRSQLIGPLLGAFIPWIGNGIYLSNLVEFDITPFTFAATGTIWAWSLFRSRILDIIPIARDEVLESMSDGVVIVDDKGRVIDINKAALAMVDRTRDAVMNRRLSESVPEYAGVITRYQPVHETTEEVELSHPSKPTRWFMLRITPLIDRLQQRVGRLVVLTNITEQKQNEAILRAARDTAEHANRTKNAFLMNVSHEFRTPLNAIIGYSELLLLQSQERGTSEFDSDLKQIHRSGNHLLAMVRDVLDLTQLEAGTLEREVRQIEPELFLHHLVVMLQPQCAENNNTLQLEQSGELRAFCTDSEKLTRILTHLIDNATKFTEHGHITVSVKPATLAQHPALAFCVGDTGIGLTAQRVDELLQPFAQGDMTATRRHGGLGLGLAIVQQFCVFLGGTLQIESRPKQGSLFTVILPHLGENVHN
jgi:PAS domain S-box-containing protein